MLRGRVGILRGIRAVGMLRGIRVGMLRGIRVREVQGTHADSVA
jgi:hypothetical protein